MTYNISKVFVDFLPPLLSKQLPCICELGVSDLPNPYSSCKMCGGQGSNILGWSRAHQGRRWAPLVGNPHVSHSLRGRTSPSLPATSFTHLAPTLPSRPLASSHRPGFFWLPLFPAGLGAGGAAWWDTGPHGWQRAGASGSWGVYLRRPVSQTFCKRIFGPVGSVEPLSGGCPDVMGRWYSHEAGEGLVGSHQAECCHCSGQKRGVSEQP